MKRSLLIIFIVLLLDQAVKIYIKTHMYLGQEVHVFGNWFIIHFTENYGMAFGLEFGGSTGKFLLSIFRIVAVFGIGYYVTYLIRHKRHRGLITCFSLILAGAIGNIIDSAFYGLIFSESNFQLAKLFPPEGGYASFLQGRVVDMIYVKAFYPGWLPLIGGKEIFPPVFNIADSAISIGVFSLVIWQKKFFVKEKKAEEQQLSREETQ